MVVSLESPYSNGKLIDDRLYLLQGEEIVPTRPPLTGDIYSGFKFGESPKARSVMILQHPCSMRSDGVKLRKEILVAELVTVKETAEKDWKRFYNLLPLPGMKMETGKEGHEWAVDFHKLRLVKSADLRNREVVLSHNGICLLLQRWVHYSSRVVVPVSDFDKATGSFVEETDLVEEWCETLDVTVESDIQGEWKNCLDWMRTAEDGSQTPQERLKSPQERQGVRMQMRKHLKARLSGES